MTSRWLTAARIFGAPSIVVMTLLVGGCSCGSPALGDAGVMLDGAIDSGTATDAGEGPDSDAEPPPPDAGRPSDAGSDAGSTPTDSGDPFCSLFAFGEGYSEHEGARVHYSLTDLSTGLDVVRAETAITLGQWGLDVTIPLDCSTDYQFDHFVDVDGDGRCDLGSGDEAGRDFTFGATSLHFTHLDHTAFSSEACAQLP